MAGQARARGQKQQKPPAGAKERFPSATAFAAVGFAVAAMVAAYASGPALQGLVGTASRAEPVTEPTPSSDVHEAAADAGAAVPTSAPTRPEPAKPTVTHADSPDCRDTSENCAAWAEHGECAKNSAYMRGACPKSCSACAGPVEEGPETSCKDLNDACATWARAGECESNPGYMIVECAHSCRTCHLRDPKVRCKRDPKEPQRLRPYRMGEIFRAVQAGKYDAQYGPVAVHSTSPWVVTFDHFLTEAECDEIVALMPPSKYERSSNVGGMTENGRFKASFDSTRTSENAWCDGACANASVMIEVARRVEDITGIPMPNAEYMQMLRYYEGQYYKSHHDYIPQHNSFPFGPRVFTFFIYLSDVEEGGETRFPYLNISVHPKKGRALLWPSVKDAEPINMDTRTQHEARPVIRGTKYAGNFWLHQWDFRNPHATGCAP